MKNRRRVRQLSGLQYCRLKAFRAGYEDVREGREPKFDDWGTHDRVYETGRSVATFIREKGEPLRPVPRPTRFFGADLGWVSGWTGRYHAETPQ